MSNEGDRSKYYILIDDNSEALDLLAQQIGRDSRSELAVSRLTLIWPNTAELVTTYLEVTKNDLQTQGLDVTLAQVRTVFDLAAKILELASVQGPVILVSDVNMNAIELLTTGYQSQWLDSNSELSTSIAKFLSHPEHALILYSGSGNIGKVADSLGGQGSRVFPLRKHFDVEAKVDAAIAVAQEIKETVAGLGGTRLERLWANRSTEKWFTENPIFHTWPNTSYHVTDDYKTAVTQVLNVGTIPDKWWKKSFHESLKGVVGAHFCGSGNKRSGVIPDKPLRLGGVAIIALLALHEATKDDETVSLSAVSCFESFFSMCSVNLAERPFLLGTDREEARRTSLALWWAFSRTFDRSEGGELTQIGALSDGFELTFSWDTSELFSTVSKMIHRQSNTAINGHPNRIFSNTSQAVAEVVAALMMHPGRFLEGNHSIRVQAVAGYHE